MGKQLINKLTRRERQIMDILYREGDASVTDVKKFLPNSPSYTAVRTLMTILEAKGFINHTVSGKKFIYNPVIPRDRARKSALKHLLQTFFEGSANSVVATLMDVSGAKLTDKEYAELKKQIELARKQRR